MSTHLNDLSSVYLNNIQEKKCKDGEKNSKKANKKPRWWDDDGDGIGYEPGEVDGKFPKKDKKKSKKKVVDEAKKSSLKQARKNVGMDPDKPSCWTGYKAKGTKMKNGRSVPNCVKEDELGEIYKGKHGQSEKEYQDSRSDAGKMISGDSQGSGANYAYKAKNTGPNPAGGSKKPQGQARMGARDREYLKYRKANMLNNHFSDWRSELTETLGEGIIIEVEKKKSLKNNSEKVTDGPVDNSSIIKINPDFKEGIEYLGGTIVEFTEVSEGEDRENPTPQQRLNRDAGKIAAKKLKQRDHEKFVNFLQHDEEVQWVANTAAEYFVEEGLNEDGIEILIEELGLESFVEYVYELSEEVLTEARAGGVRVEPVTKTGKSVGSLRGGARTSAIKRLRKEKQARRDSESGSSKPSGMTSALKSQSARAQAVKTAKKQQPKRKGLLDRVGDAVVKGIERHNKAMATAKKLSNETGKTLKKAGKVAGAVAKGAGEGVKMAGNAAKVAHKVATEEVKVDEAVVYGGTPAKKKEPKLVTKADKLGNTPAYQRLRSGDKNYKAADHLTDHMEMGEDDMRLRLKERMKAAYEVTSPYIVDEAKGSPKPTRLPKSRERDIGKHDDWKDKHPDTRDWGDRPEAGKKLKRRLNAVVGTQRRQDKETGVGKEPPKKKDESLKKTKGRPTWPSGDGHEAEKEKRKEKFMTKKVSYLSQSDQRRRLHNSYEVDSPFVVEKKMTKKQKNKKGEIADSMNKSEFEKRYPGRGEEVMYATATKLAQKCSESSFNHEINQDNHDVRANQKKEKIAKAAAANAPNAIGMAKKRGIVALPPTKSTKTEELSIDDQMRISREYNRKSPEEKRAANKKAMGNVKKVTPKKDTRTDAQKMTDATGPRDAFGRPAKSGYRGD